MDVEYEVKGDPDSTAPLTAKDHRRQRVAQDIADAVARSHFHQSFGPGEETHWISHSHNHEDDEVGHVHPPHHAFPLRADGGYWETYGPSIGHAPPPEVVANVRRVLEDLARRAPTPATDLVTWRLRLYCGHVVERTAHRSSTTIYGAFAGSLRCTECGLKPASIVAARVV